MEVLIAGGVIQVACSGALICYKMADTLRQQIKEARHNKKQCALLGQRVQALVNIVQDLQAAQFNNQAERYVGPIERFKFVLDAIIAFVQSSAKKNILRRVKNASGIAEKISQLNEQLAAVLAELNVGIQAERIFKREEDEVALRADFQELQGNLAGIIQEESAMVKIGLSALASQADRDELYEKTMASILAAVQGLTLGSPVAVDHLIDPRLLIPFYEFKFEQRIGEGGFGKIYRGRYCEAPVVIKAIEGVRNAAKLAEFKREVQIMSQLRNPYVIQLYGACIESDRACIVMEYAQQGNLSTYLQSYPALTLAARHEIILGIALGLSYLHSKAVIHRDLKAENIVITEEGHPKLIDFGLAKSRAAQVKTSLSASQAVEYHAPEVLKGQAYTMRAEIFSFGMLCWEVIKGQKPFSNRNLNSEAISRAILNGERETIDPGFPEPYASFIKRCWSSSSALRPSLAEIIGLLRGQDVGALPAVAPLLVSSPQRAEALYAQAQRFEFVQALIRACEYYEKAIAQGHMQARTNLGFLLLQGKGGVVKDVARGVRLLEKAGSLGHERAIKNLIRLYQEGQDSLCPDPKKVTYWQNQLGSCSASPAQLAASAGLFGKPAPAAVPSPPVRPVARFGAPGGF